MSKLQGKLAEDTEWTDMPTSTHPQQDLTYQLEYMKGHGFKVKERDDCFEIINRLTGKVASILPHLVTSMPSTNPPRTIRS